jgi:hypothetical protein
VKDELASCLVFVIHGGCVRIVAVFVSSTVMITYNLPRNDVPRSVRTDLLFVDVTAVNHQYGYMLNTA